jgi:hypothetical protein
MILEENYKSVVCNVLSSFQTLEFSLKIYISTAYKLIAIKINGDIPFKYDYKDIENHPLEKLLNIFQKLNDNDILIKQLNKLRNGRNRVAHRGLLHSHEVIRDIFSENLYDNYNKTKLLADELDSCLPLFVAEMNKILEIHKKAASNEKK